MACGLKRLNLSPRPGVAALMRSAGMEGKPLFSETIAFQLGPRLKDVYKRQVENNVAFVPGTHFYPEGGHENTFRLNFSNSPVDVIETGMKRLGGLI